MRKDETLRRLAELRRHIAGQVRGASGSLNALRATFAAVFECVEVFREPNGVPDVHHAEGARGASEWAYQRRSGAVWDRFRPGRRQRERERRAAVGKPPLRRSAHHGVVSLIQGPLRCCFASGKQRERRLDVRSVETQARKTPTPCTPPLFVALRADLTVEFGDERERALPRLQRVGEAASCRVRVAGVRSLENPQRAQQRCLIVLDRPAAWGGDQGEETHKMVMVRSGQGAVSTDSLHEGATPNGRDLVTSASSDWIRI